MWTAGVIDHSEAAQAKIKGLSDAPEPMPRPTKDVNLYQNNQVKVISTKEKVPIEMKSNILKARADEERHNGKRLPPAFHAWLPYPGYNGMYFWLLADLEYLDWIFFCWVAIKRWPPFYM